MKSNFIKIGFIASLAAFLTLAWSLFGTSRQSGHNSKEGRAASNGASSKPLVIYCAAGLKTPVEAALKRQSADTGIPTQLQFGGSHSLLANLEVARRGDLFISAEESYVDIARQKGLIDEVFPLARQKLVLAVRKGNPKNIRGITDLFSESVKYAQANPDTAAVGKLTRDALKKSGHWDRIATATTAYTSTVNEVANSLNLAAVDAGFIWDAMLLQHPELEIVPNVPEIDGYSAQASVAVLKSCAQPARALAVARNMAARDRGLIDFAQAGFHAADGDAWSANPSLSLHCGAMLRPAVESTLREFEIREGVSITRVYNGCGILVAQMRAGSVPDAYFACDSSFMEQVKDLFAAPLDISENQLVIVVPKGNPKGIGSLSDLSKTGLRIGVGHEKQCALGALTKETLIQARYLDNVMRNVTVQSPTGDMLVNQILTGSLDAVIAYASNLSDSRDKLDGIPIKIPCSTATQPYAVQRDSSKRQLSERLAVALRSAASKERFEAKGFKWKAK